MTENYKFAFLDINNKVINVSVFENENPETDLLQAVKEQLNANDYKSCTVYGEAFIEGHFINDRFIQMQPYPSWILNNQNYQWEPPIPMPTNEGYYYHWNEETLSWIEIEFSKE